MVPIICFVGHTNSGKTTVLEKVITELTKRHYKVGTIKHDVHGFEIDKEGKDTWRHRKAGSTVVAISSHSMMAVIKKVQEEMSLEEIVLRFFWDVDIVLAEGYKKSPYPKIEVFRKEISENLLCSSSDNLIAIVSDNPPLDVSFPVFSTQDIKKMVDFIENRYIKDRKHRSVTVLFDGKKIPMNDFVTNLLSRTLEGICSSLRGWDNPKEIVISLVRGKYE